MENEWDHSEISSDENTQSSDHSTSADIDDEEHEYVDAGGSRYFLKPKSRIVCFNCGERGHVREECTVKAPCFLCGSRDHIANECITNVCFDCYRPGHHRHECPKRKSRSYCLKCGMDGHAEEVCPDIWKSYKFARDPENLKKIYCYNCGREGHFGDDCVESDSRAPAKNSMFSYTSFISSEKLENLGYKGPNIPRNRISSGSRRRYSKDNFDGATSVSVDKTAALARSISQGLENFQRSLGSSNLNFQNPFQPIYKGGYRR